MKIGVDMVAVNRVESLTETAREKLLSGHERTLSMESQTGAIAAKEAICKALGIAPPRWLDIEVHHEKSGRPKATLYGSLSTLANNVDVSISHESGLAIAVALVAES